MIGTGEPETSAVRVTWWRIYRGRVVQAALVAAGLIGLVLLVQQLGAPAVIELFRRLPPSLFVAVLVLSAAEVLLAAVAWRFAFVRGPGVGTLLIAHLAGEALNGTTPTGRVGGEGVKAWLVSGRLHMRDTIASLAVVKAADVSAQALFLLTGVALALTVGSVDRRLLDGMLALLAVEVTAAGGFVFFQARGGLARSGELLRRALPVPKWAARGAVMRLDRTLALYYRRHPRRFAMAVACLLLNWAGSTLETFLIFRALAISAPLTNALVATAAASGIGFIGFFVPAEIGVREGGYAAACIGIGLNGAVGLTVSLVKRFTELVAWAVGLAALAMARRGARRERVAAADVLAPGL